MYAQSVLFVLVTPHVEVNVSSRQHASGTKRMGLVKASVYSFNVQLAVDIIA